MSTIFKWIFTAAVIYFGVNWIADNPETMASIRLKMNEAVKEGAEWAKENASKAMDEAVKSAQEAT